MKWIAAFTLICLATLGTVLAALWIADGSVGLGLTAHGYVALTLGVVLTSALGVGLMALVFHSNRSGRDDDVYRIDRSADS